MTSKPQGLLELELKGCSADNGKVVRGCAGLHALLKRLTVVEAC